MLGPDPTSAGSTDCSRLRDSASRLTPSSSLKSAKVGGLGKEKASFHGLKSWVAVNGLPADGRQVKGGERAGHTKMRGRGTYHVESPASASGVLGGM